MSACLCTPSLLAHVLLPCILVSSKFYGYIDKMYWKLGCVCGGGMREIYYAYYERFGVKALDRF